MAGYIMDTWSPFELIFNSYLKDLPINKEIE